jgi:esterase/lipase superfamily enzyme
MNSGPMLPGTQVRDPTSVRLFFVTNRKPDHAEHLGRYFGDAATGELTFGTAEVHVPTSHQIGTIERPGPNEKEDPARHIIIESVEQNERQVFLDVLRNTHHPGLLFVHGYNNTFESSLWDFARIIWDLQLKDNIIPIMFSWPSAGGYGGYAADKDNVLDSVKSVIEAVKLLCNDAALRPLHVIAHSMGNLLVLHSLSLLSSLVDNHGVAIKELVMAAPDVDQDHFRSLIKQVSALANGMTLYCSSRDPALMISNVLSGKPKAGYVGGNGPVIVAGLDTIDVSAAANLFNWLAWSNLHTTYVSHKSVLT